MTDYMHKGDVARMLADIAGVDVDDAEFQALPDSVAVRELIARKHAERARPQVGEMPDPRDAAASLRHRRNALAAGYGANRPRIGERSGSRQRSGG